MPDLMVCRSAPAGTITHMLAHGVIPPYSVVKASLRAQRLIHSEVGQL